MDPKNSAMDPKNRVINCGCYSAHCHLFLRSSCNRKSDFTWLIHRKSRERGHGLLPAGCGPESYLSLEELYVALSLTFNSSFPKLI